MFGSAGVENVGENAEGRSGLRGAADDQRICGEKGPRKGLELTRLDPAKRKPRNQDRDLNLGDGLAGSEMSSAGWRDEDLD